MGFSKTASLRFNNISGITLDNAYDPIIRREYINFMNENDIRYIRCQDNDMSLLSFFPDIEFLTVPEDAEKIGYIENLKNLRGLEIPAKLFDLLELSNLPLLEKVVIFETPKRLEKLEKISNLKQLWCVQWNISDLTCLHSIDDNLEDLHLEFCNRLSSLIGIENFHMLRELEMDYCLRLKDISQLSCLKSHLSHLIITDCNQINNLSSILSELSELTLLYITSFETQKNNTFDSLKFLDKLQKMIDFMTDYIIEDNDLMPLKRIRNVTVLNYKSSYNVKESELNSKK